VDTSREGWRGVRIPLVTSAGLVVDELNPTWLRGGPFCVFWRSEKKCGGKRVGFSLYILCGGDTLESFLSTNDAAAALRPETTHDDL